MVRRFFIFLIATLCAGNLFATHVYIGSSEKGIYLADFDEKSGKLSAPALVSDTVAPSYFAIHPDGRYLYAVNEVTEGSVTGFSIDRTSGKLTPVNTQSVRSAGPCYVAIDKTGHFLVTANYAGGSITVLPIESGGKLGDVADFIQHKGSGPNRDRQTMPHPHWVGFIPKSGLALVADLGIDEIAIYNFDPKKGSLTVGNPAFMTIPGGAGPRHGAMHPTGKFFYVITELSDVITEYYFEAELKRFTAINTVSILPEDFKGDKTAVTGAEIAVHPSGKFAYASIRGLDNIAVYSITDMKRGLLKGEQHIATGGKTPRQFEIDPSGHWLLVGNQDSNDIAIFSIDTSTGKLTASSMVQGVVKPACIKFAK